MSLFSAAGATFAALLALFALLASTSREPRPPAAVPGGRFFSQARREALLPALPGPPQPPCRRVGQRVALADRLHRHQSEGWSQMEQKGGGKSEERQN